MSESKIFPTTFSTSSSVTEVSKIIKTGQENQTGLVGAIALGAITIAGLAIKVIKDLKK